MIGRRPLLLGAVALVVTTGAMLGARRQRAPEHHYIMAAVERGDLRTTVTATGTVNAVVMVEVGSQLSGQIAELLADFNDEVRRGQPIALLDPRSFEASVREAEAALGVVTKQVVHGEAADRRLSGEGGMRPVHVVDVEPAGQRGGPLP